MTQKNAKINILAIETSCDETAISIVEAGGGFKRAQLKMRSSVVLSQVKLHAKYGGVYPSLAKREHGRNLLPVLRQALQEAGCGISNSQFLISNQFSNKIISRLKKIFEREPELLEQFLQEIPKLQKPKISAIAVTYGPGLEPALWVGINFAKALSLVWGIPVVPVNHMEGHIFSAFIKSGAKNSKFKIQNSKFPMLALLVSGGHTELVLVKDWLKYRKIGETRDDAAGEAFDKVARILGLPYPGGPEISRIAKQGVARKAFALPRPMMHSGDFDLSFSGLKTAVLYMVRKIKKVTPQIRADIAREFEEAVADVLAAKTVAAAQKYNISTILLGGGVAANEHLRERLSAAVKKELSDASLLLPDRRATTDNAAMIAVAGYFRYLRNGALRSASRLRARGNLGL